MIRRLLPLALLATASLFADEAATPGERIKIAKDFKVELLYTVPKGEQGSWVRMCLDDKGRLIASD